jgi:hypothetical protein
MVSLVRYALVVVICLMACASALATEQAVIASTAVSGCRISCDDFVHMADRAAQKKLQAEGYSVLIVPAAADSNDDTLLRRLLVKHRATLVLRARITAPRLAAKEDKNDWSVLVNTIRRGDEQVRLTENHCEGCEIGPIGRSTIERALSEPPTAPAGAATAPPEPNAEHTEVATATATPQPHENNPPSEPVKAATPPSSEPPVLFPPPSPPATPEQRSGLSPAALGVLAGATVLVGAGGVVVLAIGGRTLAADNTPTCSSGAVSQCPTLFDTKTPGAAMVAVGAVAVVGAAVGLGFELTALQKARRRRYSVAPTFVPNGVGVSLGGGW